MHDTMFEENGDAWNGTPALCVHTRVCVRVHTLARGKLGWGLQGGRPVVRCSLDGLRCLVHSRLLPQAGSWHALVMSFT